MSPIDKDDVFDANIVCDGAAFFFSLDDSKNNQIIAYYAFHGEWVKRIIRRMLFFLRFANLIDGLEQFVFDWYIFDNSFNHQIGGFHRIGQIGWATDTTNGIGNKFILCNCIVLDLLFGNAGQTIFDATKRLLDQIAVDFNQCNIIAGCSSDLKQLRVIIMTCDMRQYMEINKLSAQHSI